MEKELSDRELIRNVRGKTTQIEFAKQIGVTQSVVSQYERGAAAPGAEIWLRIARFSRTSFKVLCWQRAGLNRNEIETLFEALRIENEPRSQQHQERVKAAEFFRQHRVLPETVYRPLGDESVGGKPESHKGPSESVEEFCARNGLRLPAEPISGEPKPAAPAKKAKRQRRSKK